ncbi:MAG TPA: hypothetical protein VGC87_02015 [Pyrinomonadaceae bacterium]|jgi:hypothetical protein
MQQRARLSHFFVRRVMMAAVVLCLCLTVILAQENQPKDGRYYEAQARQAYQKKDYASFLENMKAAAASTWSRTASGARLTSRAGWPRPKN